MKKVLTIVFATAAACASPALARGRAQGTEMQVLGGLTADISGFSGRTDALINTGLNIVNRAEPMLGVGGGIEIHGGRLSVDLGYRYKKISAGNTIASALNAGHDYRINQVRVGIGVRF